METIFLFVSFVFFKVATTAAFPHSLTIIACALTAFGSLFLVGAAHRIGRSAAAIAHRRKTTADDAQKARSIPGATETMLQWMLGASALSVGLAILVAFGFSRELWRDLFPYYGGYGQFAWYCGLMALPSLAYGVFATLEVRARF